MREMLSETKYGSCDYAELPRDLQAVANAARAAAETFRELESALWDLRGFPLEQRIVVQVLSSKAYETWQEIERRGGQFVAEWRAKQAALDDAAEA